jgi:hypothetical protein
VLAVVSSTHDEAFPIYRSGTLPDPGMATDHTVVFDLCMRTCTVYRGDKAAVCEPCAVFALPAMT